MQLELTDLAKSDLKSILDYTRGRWGEQQMRRYEQLLIEALFTIEKEPFAAYTKTVKNRKFQTRYYRMEKHHIYYTIENDTIHVIRILHGQMNADLHL